MAITDPYVKSKSRRYQEGLITVERVRREDAKASFPPVLRPTEGTSCWCGNVLHHYEVKYGECLSHVKDRMRPWRYEKVAASAADRS
jgi:hypothetical protein